MLLFCMPFVNSKLRPTNELDVSQVRQVRDQIRTALFRQASLDLNRKAQVLDACSDAASGFTLPSSLCSTPGIGTGWS